MQKPENYITRAARERILGAQTPAVPVPRVSEELIKWLEATFPPKCYEPAKERIEDHLLYAGMVTLIQSMKITMTEQQMGEVALAALADEEDPQAEGVTVYSKKEN